MEDVLQVLRAETQDLHKEAERRLGLLDDALSTERYSHILKSFFEFYRQLEFDWKKELPNLAWEPDFSSKLAALQQDLRNFSHLTGENSLDLHNASGLFQSAIGPAWWGVLYVTEGSNLGGQVIHRHLEKIGAVPKNALSFYHANPAQTGVRWQKFLSMIREPALLPHAAEISRSARITFESLIAKF